MWHGTLGAGTKVRYRWMPVGTNVKKIHQNESKYHRGLPLRGFYWMFSRKTFCVILLGRTTKGAVHYALCGFILHRLPLPKTNGISCHHAMVFHLTKWYVVIKQWGILTSQCASCLLNCFTCNNNVYVKHTEKMQVYIWFSITWNLLCVLGVIKSPHTLLDSGHSKESFVVFLFSPPHGNI